MLAFDGTGSHEKTVRHARHERFGIRARHFRFQTANVLAIDEIFQRDGIGIGNQMPDGKRVLIGLPNAERDDLELGQFAWRFQIKNNRNRLRVDRRGYSGNANGWPGWCW